MTARFPHGNRVHRGNVHWCAERQCNIDLEELKSLDRFAWNGLVGLIEEAEGLGVDIDDTLVRSPLIRSPGGMVDPPWLGEFKTVGKAIRGGGARHWRLYFGEPTNHQDHVVGVRVWHKMSTWSQRVTDEREADAIRKAMKTLKWHFANEGYEWAKFPT
ncbi:hypothetical protein [Gordonia soli]|uniref:Uncharacterized protein n=1 Tax=Gordonia soli NBRC 108243 TaxID=1223545 RepID=M0QQY9_9ACTN|nr:hypothetical protein [Gordonia soli]GAC71095.1 hypothetical protein GS4_51_00330 [Gordonia soli NBRC 108243]